MALDILLERLQQMATSAMAYTYRPPEPQAFVQAAPQYSTTVMLRRAIQQFFMRLAWILFHSTDDHNGWTDDAPNHRGNMQMSSIQLYKLPTAGLTDKTSPCVNSKCRPDLFNTELPY